MSQQFLWVYLAVLVLFMLWSLHDIEELSNKPMYFTFFTWYHNMDVSFKDYI